jgi:formylglycine-generating enzyme required for sulfatase activity
MRILHACLTVVFAALAPLAATRADDAAAKLKTQKVTFKLVREDPNIKGLDRAIELVQIPAGTIVLKGPDGKDQEHAIKSIWIAKYETRWDEFNVFWMGLDMTEGQWLTFKRDISWEQYHSGQWERPGVPYMPPSEVEKGGQWVEPGISGYPASCITFPSAAKYCTWLSKLTGKRFRLPTEAEWEYACRAGGPSVKPEAKLLGDFAWFVGNSDDQPHAVGQKRPNPWGLYDMLGNVGEYVIRDPKDDMGLIAGGTWSDDAKDVTSGAREPYSPKWQKTDPFQPKGRSWFEYDLHRIGFRVVMEE